MYPTGHKQAPVLESQVAPFSQLHLFSQFAPNLLFPQPILKDSDSGLPLGLFINETTDILSLRRLSRTFLFRLFFLLLVQFFP